MEYPSLKEIAAQIELMKAAQKQLNDMFEILARRIKVLELKSDLD